MFRCSLRVSAHHITLIPHQTYLCHQVEETNVLKTSIASVLATAHLPADLLRQPQYKAGFAV